MSMLFISPLARLHFPLAHARWTWHLHDVWHVSVFTIRLLVRAVTVSHASCPCAPSSNLSIPPHHTLCILHKMCISRAALSPAHAPRTCSVALLNTHHTRISASNSPQPRIPANENAQEREGERGRDGTPLHTKSEPNPTQTATTQVGENGKGGHISYSPATWLMWVFVSVGVQLVSSPTVCSRICWLRFPGIRENSLIFGRATSRALELEVQYSESRRYPGIIGGDQCDYFRSNRKEVPSTESPTDYRRRKNNNFASTGLFPISASYFCALWSRCFAQNSFLTFSSAFKRLLLQSSDVTFTEVCYQVYPEV